jgi:uncharacterized membrane protein YphA (DoxX/SURF4 family)
MSSNLQCPVDFVLIDEHKARINAFFVLCLVSIYLLTNAWVILLLLAVDFLIRATNQGKYSIIALLSDMVIRRFKIKPKPVDRGPKRFAAWVGFSFLTAILLMIGLQQSLVAQVLIGIMMVFAALEAFAGFCAGCYVYTLGLLILKKQDK